MSRIGKSPITIAEGVTIDISSNNVIVKGPKGELSQEVDQDFKLKIEDGVLTVERPTEQKRHKALHGLYRSLIANMIEGVTTGFKKQMELVGVGYKAAVQGQVLELTLGYSHNIFLAVPEEIAITAETTKGQNPKVFIEGIDKQLVGQIAAKIKSLRKVEPYKGKGIRFIGEQVRRKAGKTASK
ncbi:MAG: 50S ribosomal protein L6 [Cyclobacteriaceae bacterium]